VIASAGITATTGQPELGESTLVSAIADRVVAGGRRLTVSSNGQVSRKDA